MHDSNHGAYSNHKLVNKLLGGVLNVMGGYAPNWRIQHNILHHTYTNLNGLDDDIQTGKLIRMCPHQELKPIHRWQHLYAWPLYGLMNVYWVLAKDYKQIFQFHREGLLRKEKKSLPQAFTEVTLFRVLFFAYALVLPMFLAHTAWYHVVIGFVLMHVVAGLSLALIFQPAHVVETSEFPLPSEAGRMENSWAVHQLLNTANFAPNNRFLTWFIGGLNRQIEHHLFPHICHIHYPRIARIVKETAREYGLAYQEYPTFRNALWAHGRTLRILGRHRYITPQMIPAVPQRSHAPVA
jgi:linoleoyl-CoA desaturase